MGMTREEAIKALRIEGIEIGGKAKRLAEFMVALDVAQKALRPVSRDQVEKAWRGECDCSNPKACCTCCSMRCQYCIGQSEYKQATFCMKCGRPLTDEAVEMVMERINEMEGMKK